MVRFGGLAELDFYIKDIPAHTLNTWEQNEIELPSDVDLETEAMILYGVEYVPQASGNLFADGIDFIRPFNFHMLKPADENDLDTCFMSKMVTSIQDDGLNSRFNEGNVVPLVPIVVITGWFESATVQGKAIVASEESFRIWYDDVPLTQSKMAQLVNILRGEQI